MNLAVVFGGKSSEHDVSVITGVMTVNAAAARHNVLPLYINGDGGNVYEQKIRFGGRYCC